MLDWLVENMLDLAGLLASLGSLAFAKRASQAAVEAKEQVRQHNRYGDVIELRRLSGLLMHHVSGEQLVEAKLRAADLQSQLQVVRARWADKLAPESAGSLQLCFELAGSLVRSFDEGPDSESQARRTEAARNLTLTLDELFGQFTAQQD